jgi:hypothetical protein
MNRKETWINETMNALDGIRPAASDPELVRKLYSTASEPHENKDLFPRPVYWSVAAGIALLVTLNVLTALHFNRNHTNLKEAPAAVATEYLTYLGTAKL